VTLRYCDHIGSLKIISWLISLTFLLSADFDITDLRTTKGTPSNFSWNRSGIWIEKLALGIQNRYCLHSVEDKAKVTINGLYKVVHGISISAKMCDSSRSSATKQSFQLWHRKNNFSPVVGSSQYGSSLDLDPDPAE